MSDLEAVNAAAEIPSVRSFAADAEHVVDVLELSKGVIDEWTRTAREAHYR